MLNVRNLLYRPSLILLGRVDYSGETGLDLSTTLTCARFCVASAKDTIQLLHSTASRLTGAFWYNIFCTIHLCPDGLFLQTLIIDIYTAATVLLGARLCSRKELEDTDEDWNLALSYLKRISSKSISAVRCLKALEVMEAQLSLFHSHILTNNRRLSSRNPPKPPINQRQTRSLYRNPTINNQNLRPFHRHIRSSCCAAGYRYDHCRRRRRPRYRVPGGANKCDRLGYARCGVGEFTMGLECVG